MTIFKAVIRTSDGLIHGVDGTPNTDSPEEQLTRRQKGASLFGGSAADYEYAELSQAQADAFYAALPGRSFLIGGVISSAMPPALSTDKVAIQNDGIDAVTITANVNDLNFTGQIVWRVTGTNGSLMTQAEAMIAGAAALQYSTNLAEGTAIIEAETVKHGLNRIKIGVI